MTKRNGSSNDNGNNNDNNGSNSNNPLEAALKVIEDMDPSTEVCFDVEDLGLSLVMLESIIEVMDDARERCVTLGEKLMQDAYGSM